MIQLFKDMFRHDSCHHQFNVFFRFPLFYIRLKFEYVNNLKFKNTVNANVRLNVSRFKIQLKLDTVLSSKKRSTSAA